MPKHLKPANGADRQKRTAHDPLKQGEGGAKQRAPKTARTGGETPADVPAAKNMDGTHLKPPRSWVAGKRTAVKGGGGRDGHDRTNPNAGKSKSEEFKASRVV